MLIAVPSVLLQNEILFKEAFDLHGECDFAE